MGITSFVPSFVQGGRLLMHGVRDLVFTGTGRRSGVFPSEQEIHRTVDPVGVVRFRGCLARDMVLARGKG